MISLQHDLPRAGIRDGFLNRKPTIFLPPLNGIIGRGAEVLLNVLLVTGEIVSGGYPRSARWKLVLTVAMSE